MQSSDLKRLASRLALLTLCCSAPLANAQNSGYGRGPINPPQFPNQYPGQMRGDRGGMDRRGGDDRLMGRTVREVIASWPARPRLGALQLLAKYGNPEVVSAQKLEWINQGPFKCIMVETEETPHDFPKPHMDFLQHTISYQIPEGKLNDVLEFDGSISIFRTGGEVSARCDSEAHNLLTLNLMNQVATGKLSSKDARAAFADAIVQDTAGHTPAMMETLQFQARGNTGFPDKAEIPNSTVREGSREARDAKRGDSEALAMLVALDENEILAAQTAEKKQLPPRVMEFAHMMRHDHGENVATTLKVGKKNDIVEVETKAVDDLRVKGAGELAQLTPLDGDAFARAYVDAMIRGHQEALRLLDRLMGEAHDNDVKRHFAETRAAVAHHLEMARQLNGPGRR